MEIDKRIKDEKLQYDNGREATETSALSTNNIV